MNLAKEIFGNPDRKKSINSREKGVKNERELAKKLQEWTGQPFARIPSSGGLRWKNDSRTVGDLIPEDETFVFPFCIETKHYAKANLDISKKSKISGAWEQAARDALRANKIPLLFYRINGMAKGSYIVYFRADDIDADYLERWEVPIPYMGNLELSIGGGFTSRVYGVKSEHFFTLNYEVLKLWVTRK